ncbi:TATA-binding protein-associated factor 172 [Tetranychus urticae]|uniref:TATA-binding protein-associated factor 172 n=1 Tax=Tetranychus urticae TaxID=32264 RepID=T1KBT3_TETUR|nr:TATA-binding protein-associated factor 172 [Tetranychus urticae]XP_015784869.1 TATA-binding protein-associated factor 172 [Tetranychus urticae]
MKSRLDRLFLLLDQGTSSVTRKAAAQQLGEVQRLHPHELNNLLAKVRGYLHSSSWETRIAASLAIEAIIKQIPKWLPNGTNDEPIDNTSLDCFGGEGRMKLDVFDINKVIECGRNLLASEGTEYDLNLINCDNLSADNLREKLSAQRQLLNKKLGLDISQKLNLGIQSDDLVSNEDLSQIQDVKMENTDSNVGANNDHSENNDKKIGNLNSKKVEISELLNLNKRKAADDRGSIELEEGDKNIDSTAVCKFSVKKIKLESDKKDNELQNESKVIDLNNLKEWPLQSFCDELMSDLFNASWEVRHGAATALREIIKVHGVCGGRPLNAPKSQMDALNQLWLEDLALRLICVLALDKFGDFVSDQVVAPVRETAAQTLGSIFNIMSKDNVFSTVKILLQLLVRPEWETRHGGLLGLKYLLAIRSDLTFELLPKVFDSIFNCLKDNEDDVSAVAAAALVPVRDSLIETLPDKVPIIIDFLWDALLEIDDLTSSTSDILKLLSSLLIKYHHNDQKRLRELVPRLWPFLGHNLPSVRKSVIESLLVLIAADLAWADVEIISESLRLLYQRCLTESNNEILDLLFDCWSKFIKTCSLNDILAASTPHLSGWICLMMHPAKNAIDSKVSPVWFVPRRRAFHGDSNQKVKYSDNGLNEPEKQYLGGAESLYDTPLKRERFVIRARLTAAKFIGLLAEYVYRVVASKSPSPSECFTNLLLFHLNSKSAIQRTCVAWIIKEWSCAHGPTVSENSLPRCLLDKCLECLKETVYYDEIALSFNRLQHDARDFISTIKFNKLTIDDEIYKPGNILTIQQLSDLVSTVYQSSIESSKVKVKASTLESMEERRKAIASSIEELTRYQNSLSMMVTSALSSCIISWKILPDKLNPVVRPLMDSIKRESNEQLQRASANHLTFLLDLCLSQDKPDNSSPVNKIIKNLVTFLCSDPNFTPNLSNPVLSNLSSTINNNATSNSGSCSPSTPSTPGTPDLSNGILTLINMCKQAERYNLKRLNSSNSFKKSTENPDEETSSTNIPDDNDKFNELIRRGASFALTEIVAHFGDQLPERLPQMWAYITNFQNLVSEANDKVDVNKAQELIQCLQVLEVIAPYLHLNLHPHLRQLLPKLCSCLENYFYAVRHLAARCIGVLSTVITPETMDKVLGLVLDMLGSSDSDLRRQGAVEAIYCVVDKLGISIVPFIVLLIIPMLGRMSDTNEQVRLLATHCFAQLIQLMPLDDSKSNKVPIKSELLEKKNHEQHFLEQLMNPKKLENFKIPVPVNAELRSYQQEGVNWLSFLNRYKLHGILCDEMGLGKTLMSICILASDHYMRSEKYKKTKAPDSKPLPSIVICPPTLTGHWVYEVEKFVDSTYLHPLNYAGPPIERAKLRNKLKNQSNRKSYNLVIASYDIVRNDIDFFSSISWNYCILDEGHIIKNGKTKLSKAIKSLNTNHRLILTGTPIQNNVLELWSLFDFLIPGFLGTERQFAIRYSKPILQSRDAKSSSKEQESGVLAMESLHRQSLPFILRRMKEDVLKDLPPKIMQDYYCELSTLQSQLYEDFAKSRARASLESSVHKLEGGTASLKSVDSTGSQANSSHIFQALQYLRKVCNHPKLVLTPHHPQYDSIISRLKDQSTSLNDISHAAKLCALKQLLLDCGIGCSSSSTLMGGSQPVVNQHRALIFCQLKGMLDIVENDLLKTNMPSVSYLRLDGSIPPGSRQSVVFQFNNDPSIDVLLLTTQVGGLGLNLTGADTVIFVEHDWNPMKDLQAMDRAHRIGQKKVVNVYRLITKGTLEEKIMGLQKFKMTIANTVISSDNSQLQTMGTDQLLDLFCLDNKNGPDNKEGPGNAKGSGVKSVLENLPELWDTNQYEDEYDLSNFIESLKS